MSRSVFDRAMDVYAATLPRAPRDGLAHPFGADQHPPHRWRVSRDVWDALRAHVGSWVPKDPPPDAHLLGEPLVIDGTLPDNSMLLEPQP